MIEQKFSGSRLDVLGRFGHLLRQHQQAIASAYLEKGDFEQADNYLSLLKEPYDRSQHLEYQIRWLELSGKLHLLWGNLGVGLKRFQQVQEKCTIMRSQRAVLRSNLNFVHILILLNQTSTCYWYIQW